MKVVVVVVILVILGALALYRPVHDCGRLASLCASHYAVWAPPYGGTAPYQHHLYGLCACAATLTVHGG